MDFIFTQKCCCSFFLPLFNQRLKKYFNFSISSSNDEEGQRLLKQLSDLNEPLEINFSEMIKLMKQCDMVEKLNATNNSVRRDSKREADPKQALFPRSPLSLLNGIIPGNYF